MGKLRYGIDLGGTKIEGVILDEETFDVKWRHRIPTEKEKGYEHILNQLHRMIGMMADEVGYLPERVGVGTPGTLDPITQTMKNSNTTCMNGKPMLQDLQEKVGTAVVFANDANCFALAEAKMGIVQEAMPDAKVVFGVIMGTGVGGGIVINGEVLEGRQGIGGEWGHIHLDDSGGRCYCGKVGCVERIFAGPHLERYYEEQSGKKLKLKEIVRLARSKEDKYAIATLDRLIHFFGKGLAKIINILDPDAIVLGGGVGNIDELYTFGVQELEKHVFNHRMDTRIFRPKLGDSAGVFGAAFL